MVQRSAVQLFALLLPCALTGCPLSDNYFVDPNAGRAGSHSLGGTGPLGGGAGIAGVGAAAGASAAGAATGGNGASGGGGTGTNPGGTGAAETGGAVTLGGTAGAGAAGGGPSAGEPGDAGASQAGGAAGAAGEGPCVPEPEVCDGSDNDCNDAIDEGGVCPAHCSAREREGRVYVLCLWALAANGPDYETASTRCAGMGTELGIDGDFELSFVETQLENAWLKEWIGMSTSVADGAVWMGANDIGQENTWVWGRGPNAVQFFRGYPGGGGIATMNRFNDFGVGRPNSSNGDEDCGAFDAEVSWQWNDRQCASKEIGFVCEQRP